jgi:serpin B
MDQTASLSYYADQRLFCVEMPYGNQAFSMIVVLPAENSTIDQLIDYLDHEQWQNVVDNLRPREVWLKLPRFKIECEKLLNEPVKNTGIKRIFQENLADFSNISTIPLIVSIIKQKTFVEVNEEGTEAAAVTVIGMGVTSVGPAKSVPFFANRPFLYLIKEKSTGTILFIGRMDEPKE